MKKIIINCIVLMLLLSQTSCLQTGNRRKNHKMDVYNLYIACDSQEDTVTGIFMNEFARILEEDSKGRIKMNTYPNSQLGSDSELIEAVQNGNISFCVGTSAPQVSFVPQAAIFDAPMAFKNLKIARKVLDGPLYDKLKIYYKEKDLRLLAIADQGFRLMSSNKNINSIKDFKGIKIRTMENKNHIAFWKAIGANPTPMAWPEVYIGLEQGFIDAQENPLELIVASKIYEKQKYIINTNHILHSLMLIGSEKVLNDLPEDLQKTIDESAQKAKQIARVKTDLRYEGRLKIIKDYGCINKDLSPQLYKDMKEASKSIWLDMENQVDKDLINLFKSEIERSEKNEY